jgi:hypothetical protein
MNNPSDLYNFVFRGILAEDNLDAYLGVVKPQRSYDTPEIAKLLSTERFDDSQLLPAQAMSIVYIAIACFENHSRNFVNSVLTEKVGDDWWNTEGCVSTQIKSAAEKRRKEEIEIKWHGKRGDDMLQYLVLGDLAKLIKNNWEHFSDHLKSQDWSSSIFDIIEKSRNVIMHSGILGESDVYRIGIFIKDWLEQTGG